MRLFRLLFLIIALFLLLYPFKRLADQGKVKDVFVKKASSLFTDKNKSLKERLYQLPQKLDEYFQGEFPYRKPILDYYLYVWEDILGAPVKTHATARNGEWIPSFDEAPVLGNYLGLYPLTPEELTLFQLRFLGMHTFFRLHNIEYLLVTIPDKPTTHPEIMPFWANWHRGESHYAQRAAVLKSLNIPWLDMLKVFKEHPSKRFYSRKVDTTHWNGEGKLLAYEKISERLAKIDPVFAKKPNGIGAELKENAYNSVGKEFTSVISARFLSLDQFEHTTLPELAMEVQYGWNQYERYVNKKPLSNKSVLLLGDSYTIASFDYNERGELAWRDGLFPVAYHAKVFYKAHYNQALSSNLKEAFKSGHKPDIVIEAFGERVRYLRFRKDNLILMLGEVVLNKPSSVMLTPQTICDFVEGFSLNNIAISAREAKILHKESIPPWIELKPVVSDADGRVALMMRFPKSFDKSGFTLRWINEDNPEERRSFPVSSEEGLVHTFFFTKPNQKIRVRLEFSHAKDYALLPMPEEVLTLQKSKRNR